MQILKIILGNSLMIGIASLLILVFSPDSLLIFSIPAIGIICLASLIYVLILGKWLRFVLTFIGFGIVFMVAFMFIIAKGISESAGITKSVGDEKFYKTEIEKMANVRLLPELKILEKLDTIEYMFQGEYNAECLYKGPSKFIADLESDILSQKEFTKVSDTSELPLSDITEKHLKVDEIKSIYKKVSEGSYIIYVAFDKQKSKFYYSALYY